VQFPPLPLGAPPGRGGVRVGQARGLSPLACGREVSAEYLAGCATAGLARPCSSLRTALSLTLGADLSVSPPGSGSLEWDFCVRFGFQPLLRGLCGRKGSVSPTGGRRRTARASENGRFADPPQVCPAEPGLHSSGGALEAPPKTNASGRTLESPASHSARHYTTLSPKSQEKNLRRHAHICKAFAKKELEFQNSSHATVC
jgi:hypothetical protein